MGDRIARAAALAAAIGMGASTASAICRVVEPLASSGAEPVVFDPTTMALFVVAPDQLVDYECPEEPAGTTFDDAREPVMPHYEMPFDRLEPLPAAELEEATSVRRCWDGSVATEIFDTLTHVVVRPAIYANGGTAGLIMPVPRRADVHVGPGDLFDSVSRLQRAEVDETVEYVEDEGLGYQCSDPHYSALSPAGGLRAVPFALMGCGGDGGDYYRPGLDGMDTEIHESGDGVVELERIPTSEDYEVTMLSASTLDALLTWLDDNGLAHGEHDDAAFSAYVAEGAWFMAVKVTPAATDGERIALAPLIVTYRGEDLPITNRLQYDPAGGMLITDAWVLAPTRVEIADETGETLYAAEASIADETALAGFGLDAGWLTRIELVRFMSEVKEDTSVVASLATETVRPQIVRDLRVRVVAACCEGNAIPDSRGIQRTYMEHRVYVEGTETPGEEMFYRTPPPEPAYCPGGGSYDPGGGGSGRGPLGIYACAAPGAEAHETLTSIGSLLPLAVAIGVVVLWPRRKRR